MSYLMTAPPKFNKLVPPFLQYKNGPNLVESLQGTIWSYVENPSIFLKIVLGLVHIYIYLDMAAASATSEAETGKVSHSPC